MKRASQKIKKFVVGQGQGHGNRKYYHENNICRCYSDPQVWTHLFFVAATFVALWTQLWEGAFLLMTISGLSTVYHYTYEKPGLVAAIEGVIMKVIFLYGFLQLFQAPTSRVLLAELILMASTIAIFMVTNMRKDLYDKYHCWMHVVPAFWGVSIALYHPSVIYLFL
jgi:hypothetical protein